MRPGLSTYVFLQQRLHPGLLDALRASGATCIELFAARHHFDYTDRAAVRELALWFRDTNTLATLHQPIYITDRADTQWSRHVAPNLNLIDPEKSRRIAAMDEIKRALESAEQIPIAAISLHLGVKDDPWNLRALENSLTAIEHLKAFAHPLGVKVLLKNLQNDVTTPDHLLEILRSGHFDTVNVCLDLGHAHLSAPANNQGIDAAFEILKPRIAQLNLHDNSGQHDEHLWPGHIATNPGAPRPDSGTWDNGIDWTNVARHIATLPAALPAMLEIAYEPEESPEAATKKAATFFDNQSRLTDGLLQSNPA